VELLVVRHGISEDAAESGRDADRALTRNGRERMAAEVRGLQRLELRVDRVLHSPWRRAVETAELLEPLAGGGAWREACEHLAAPPGRALLAALRGERLAVVGHEPWLTELIALLALGNPRSGHALDLKKGGVAWLEGEVRPGGMGLRALFTPRALRRLGGDDD
jgi:phosphohistidine phosphatase